MNGPNYIYLLAGNLAINQLHIKVSDIAGNTAVTKNSFAITVDIPKIISVTYSGGINKPTVQILKDNVMLPMEITGTIERDVNILFTTHSFNVPGNGTLTVSGLGNPYTTTVIKESGSIIIPKDFINKLPLNTIYSIIITGKNSANLSAGGIIHPQSITIQIIRYKQTEISNDAITVGNINNKVYQRFKNVVSLEVKNVILPMETLLFTTDNVLDINTLSYPYILLHIREFTDINNSTDSFIDNAFCKLTLQDTNFDKINKTRPVCNFVPLSKEKKLFTPKPLDSLSKLSIYFTTPQGDLLSNVNDVFKLIDISLSSSNKILDLSLSNIDAATNNQQYFSNKLIKLGDLCFFKHIQIINLHITNDIILNNINNSFIQFLQREEGHHVHSISNPVTQSSEFNNIFSFENSLFSLFNDSIGTFTVNNDTYSKAKINEYLNFLQVSTVHGFMMNASLQHNITLAITTKEYYMDYSKNKRII